MSVISAYLGVSGLIDVGYRFYTSAEAPVAARITTGIVDAGDGWYSVDATIPATGNSVRWDSTGTTDAVAREYLDLFNDPWTKAVPNGYAAGTAGKVLGDNLDAKISSRLAPTAAGRTLDVSATGEAGLDWANVGSPTTAVNLSGTNIKTDQVVAPVTLTAAYDPAKTASTQASVNAISGYVDTEVGAIKVVTDKLDTALEVDGPVYRYTVNALENAPVSGGGGATDWTAPEREQIRHRLGIDGTATAPSTGTPSLASWNAQLPGSYGTGSAGRIIGDNVNATVTSRASQASLDTVGTGVTGVKAQTDKLNFTGVYVKATLDGALVTLSPAANNDVADAVLKRDWMLVSGEAAYSLLNAMRLLRNAWNTTEVPNNLVVKKEDGTTTAWTRPVATNLAAEPIVGVST
jgi:hypothetical protein